jgi:hypothetical protein
LETSSPLDIVVDVWYEFVEDLVLNFYYENIFDNLIYFNLLSKIKGKCKSKKKRINCVVIIIEVF